MQDEAERIAKGLTKAHGEFLWRIANGLQPGLADRAADKVRQKCRRLGLAHIVKNPRHWETTPLGLAVANIIRNQSNG